MPELINSFFFIILHEPIYEYVRSNEAILIIYSLLILFYNKCIVHYDSSTIHLMNCKEAYGWCMITVFQMMIYHIIVYPMTSINCRWHFKLSYCNPRIELEMPRAGDDVSIRYCLWTYQNSIRDEKVKHMPAKNWK